MKRLLLSFGILAGMCVQAAHDPSIDDQTIRQSVCMAKDPQADALWQLHQVVKKDSVQHDLVRSEYSGGAWHDTTKHALQLPVKNIAQAAAVVDDAGSVAVALSSQDAAQSGAFVLQVDKKGKMNLAHLDIAGVSVVKTFALNGAVYVAGQTADALHIAAVSKGSVQSVDAIQFSEIFSKKHDAMVTDVCADDQGRLYASVVNSALETQTMIISFDTQDRSFSTLSLDATAGEVSKIAVVRQDGSAQSRFVMVTRDEQNETRLASMDMFGLAVRKGEQIHFDVTNLVVSKKGIVVAGYDKLNAVAARFSVDGTQKENIELLSAHVRSGNNKVATYTGVCVLSDGSVAADITYQSLNAMQRNRSFRNVNNPLIAAAATVVVPGQLDVILDGGQSLVTVTGVTLDDATPVDQHGLTAIVLSNFSVESDQIAIDHDDQALVPVSGTIDIAFNDGVTARDYNGVEISGYIVVSVDSTASGGNAQVAEGIIFGLINNTDYPGEHLTITIGDSNVQAPTIEEFTAQVGAGAGGVTFTAAYNGLSTFISVTEITLDSTTLSGGWTLGANDEGITADITVSGAGFIPLNTLGTIAITAQDDIWLTAPGGTFANPALGSVKIATAGVTVLGNMYFLIDGQGRVTLSPRELECTDEGVCTLQTRLLQIADINHDGDGGTDEITVSLAINPEIELNLDTDIIPGPVLTDLQVGGSASAVSFDKVLYDGTVVYIEVDGITFTGVSATGGLTNYTLSGSSLSGSGSRTGNGNLDISVTGTGTLAVTGYNGTNYSGGGSTSVSLSGTVRVVVDLTGDADITVSAVNTFAFSNEGSNDDIDGSLNITATNIASIDDQSTQTISGTLVGTMIYTGSSAILNVTDVTFTGLDTDWSFTAGPSMTATFAAADGVQTVDEDDEEALININHFVSTGTLESPAGTLYNVIFDESVDDTSLIIDQDDGSVTIGDGTLDVREGTIIAGPAENLTPYANFTLNASLTSAGSITVTYLDLSDAALIGTMTYTGLSAVLDITGISFPNLPEGWTFTESVGTPITGAFAVSPHVMDAASDVALIIISGQGTLSNGSESFTISIANTGATAVAIGVNGALSVSNGALTITDLNGAFADISFATNIATLTGITVTDHTEIAANMDAQWEYVYDGVAGIIRLNDMSIALYPEAGEGHDVGDQIITNDWTVTGATLRWNNEANFVQILVPLSGGDAAGLDDDTGVATGDGVVANGVIGTINLTDEFDQTIVMNVTGTVTPNLVNNSGEGSPVLFNLSSGSLTGSSANADAPDNGYNDDINITLTINSDSLNDPGSDAAGDEDYLRNIVQQDITSIDGLDVSYNGLYVIIDASDSDLDFTLAGVTSNDGHGAPLQLNYEQAWSFTNISNIEFAGVVDNILYLQAPEEGGDPIEYTVPITFTADLISTYSNVAVGAYPAFTGLGAVSAAEGHTFSGNLIIAVDNSGDNIGAGGDQQINVDITGGISLSAVAPLPGRHEDINAYFVTSAQDLDVTNTATVLSPRVHLNFNPESGNTLQYNGIDVTFLGDADIDDIDNHAGWDVVVENTHWYVSDGEGGFDEITTENPLHVRVDWDGNVVQDIYLNASFTFTPQVPAGSDQEPTALSINLSDDNGGNPIALKFIVQDDGTVNIGTGVDPYTFESVIFSQTSFNLPQDDTGFTLTITLDTDDVEDNPTTFEPEFITTEANINAVLNLTTLYVNDFNAADGIALDGDRVYIYFEEFQNATVTLAPAGVTIDATDFDLDLEDWSTNADVTLEYDEEEDALVVIFDGADTQATIYLILETDEIYEEDELDEDNDVDYVGTWTIIVDNQGRILNADGDVLYDGDENLLAVDDVSVTMYASLSSGVLYDGVQAALDISGLGFLVEQALEFEEVFTDFNHIEFNDSIVYGDDDFTFTAESVLNAFDGADSTITGDWEYDYGIPYFVSVNTELIEITGEGTTITGPLDGIEDDEFIATIAIPVTFTRDGYPTREAILSSAVEFAIGEGIIATGFSWSYYHGVTEGWLVDQLSDVVVTNAYATDVDDAALVSFDAANQRVIVNISQLEGDDVISVTIGVQGVTTLTYDVSGFDEVEIPNVTVTGTVTGTINRLGVVEITGNALVAEGLYLDGTTTDAGEEGGTGDIALTLTVNADTLDDIDDISEVQGSVNLSGVAINNGTSIRILLSDDELTNLGNCCLGDGDELVDEVMVLQELTINVDQTVSFAGEPVDENGATYIIAYPLEVSGTVGLHYVGTNTPIEDIEIAGVVYVNITQDPDEITDDLRITLSSAEEIAASDYLDDDFTSSYITARVDSEGDAVEEGGILITITLNIVDEDAVEVANNFCPASVFSGGTNPSQHSASLFGGGAPVVYDEPFNDYVSGEVAVNNFAALLLTNVTTLQKYKDLLGVQAIYDTMTASINEVGSVLNHEQPAYWIGLFESYFDGDSSYLDTHGGAVAAPYNIIPNHSFKQFVELHDTRTYVGSSAYLVYKIHGSDTGTGLDQDNIDSLLAGVDADVKNAVILAANTLIARALILQTLVQAASYIGEGV